MHRQRCREIKLFSKFPKPLFYAAAMLLMCGTEAAGQENSAPAPSSKSKLLDLYLEEARGYDNPCAAAMTAPCFYGSIAVGWRRSVRSYQWRYCCGRFSDYRLQVRYCGKEVWSVGPGTRPTPNEPYTGYVVEQRPKPAAEGE